jgi:serine/threonine-protein kinase
MHDAEREDFRRIDELLDRAMEASAHERANLLAGCADAALRARVAALLEIEDRPGPLDRAPLELAAEALLDAGSRGAPQAEQRIGAYVLRHPLGEGGMATVWLAERGQPGISQQVAIKCLKAGLATPDLRARFVREQQILARLNHPHIAQLHDAGVSGDGVPYIVMELVDGEPITTYCDARGLGLRARLALFRKALDAVACAQRNLVVHRDLKPANLLVTRDGVPKLLDFGIAKPLDDDATHTLMRALTPAYAAPEQARGEAVTTATDVYALGVCLHELLAGTKPDRAADGTPLPPSQTLLRWRQREAASAGGGSAADRAARRRGHADAARLAASLRGEIGTVLLTALQPDPARRYASAAALDEDIDRLLARQPLRARRDRRSYRLRKFVQRNWLASGALAAVVVALAVGGMLALWQAREARIAAGHAQAVQDFLLGVFDAAQPDPRGGGTLVTTREIADRSARRLREQLGSGPQPDARILLALGHIYLKMQLTEQAAPLFEQAVRATREDATRDPAAFAEALEARGLMHQQSGHYREARGDFDEALQWTNAGPADVARRASLLISRARAESGSGDPDAATATLAAARAELARSPRPDPNLRLQAALVASATARRAGHSDAAVREADEAAAIATAAFGDASSQQADAQGARAAGLRLAGRLVEAAEAQRRLLQIDREILREVMPGHLYRSGLLELDAGDYTRAERAFRDALRSEHLIVGDEASDLGSYEEGLARALFELGRYDEAETLARRAVARYERAEEDAAGELAQMRLTLADVLAARGASDDARQRYDAVLAATIAPRTARARRQRLFAELGRAALDARPDSAAATTETLRRALARIDAGLDPLTRLAAQVRAGEILLAAGADGEAIAHARRAARLAIGLPADHPLLAHASLVEAGALFAQGDRKHARVPLAIALRVLEARLPASHPALARARRLAAGLGTSDT